MLAVMAPVAQAGPKGAVGGTFASIDGGVLRIEDWRGQVVMVVNTASRCAFTDQYRGLQARYDRYREQGLVVLAVPSGDFNQELGSAEEVKDFCELSYGLDLPMTDITSVRGRSAHEFYKAVRSQTGFVPRWNFNKVLIGADGTVRATWGSNMRPEAGPVIRLVETLLAEERG
ncbi:MAG: glutathione peroxidase [Sedimentitalea sp.]